MIKSYLILAVSLLFFSLPSLASDAEEDEGPDWYQVELLVFEYVDKAAITDEKWPTDIVTPHPNSIVRLRLPRPERNPKHIYQQVFDDSLTMEGIIRAFNRAKSFRLLNHVGWQQPLLPVKQARTVYIIGGDNYYDDEGVTSFSELLFDDRLGNDEHVPLYEIYEQLSPSLWELEGAMTVGLHEPYVQIIADFTRYYPLPDLTDAAGAPEQYQRLKIDIDQRLRSERLYYFDHPTVGVMLKIQPIDPPELEEIEEVAIAPESLPSEPLIFRPNIDPHTHSNVIE